MLFISKIITIIITKRDENLSKKKKLFKFPFLRPCYQRRSHKAICRANNLDSSLWRGIPSIEVRTTLRRVRFSPSPWSPLPLSPMERNGRLPFFLFVREFSNERTRVERRAAYQKAKRKRLFTTAFSAYLKWITQAGFSKTIDLPSTLSAR